MGAAASTDGEQGSNYEQDKRRERGREGGGETEELDGKNGVKQRDEADGEDKGG